MRLPLSDQFLSALFETRTDWQDQVTETVHDYTVPEARLLRERAMDEKQAQIALAIDYYQCLMDGKPLRIPFITFICGAPRTGGTYLLKSMCAYYGVNTDQHAAVLHDGFPALLTYIDDPSMRAWHWAQWLALVANEDYVIKKLHTLAYDMDMADLLGAEVIGTIRDPLAALKSVEDRGRGDIGRQVLTIAQRLGCDEKSADFEELWLMYWEDYYSRLRVHELIEFGPDMAQQWDGEGFVSPGQ